MAKLEIKGMEQLKRRLKALGKEAAPAGGKALLAGAQIIAEEARRTAPRGNRSYKRSKKNSWRTGGHMADNILATQAQTTGTILRAGVTVAGGLQSGPYFYIRFLEFGTRRISARRFVQHAAEAKENEALTKVEQTLKEELTNIL